MVFIGNQPTAVPLTSDQLTDGLITTAKIATGAVENVDIASNTINLTQKVTGTLPVANGGTGLAALGTAGQALVVNSTATALQFATVGATAGQVIQVVSTTKQDVFGLLGTTTFTDITGLSVSVTPSSASNKILVLVDIASGQSATSVNAFRLVRGSTAIGGGTASGSRQSAFATGQGVDTNGQFSSSFNHLDSPSTTSSTTYKIQMICNDTAAVNQTRLDTDTNGSIGCRTSSTITVMEIKG
jgi:hypothetical protein